MKIANTFFFLNSISLYSVLQTIVFGIYFFSDNNATLEIRKAVYTKDTGAYKCKARNPAGVGQDIATVFIENGKVPQYTTGQTPGDAHWQVSIN